MSLSFKAQEKRLRSTFVSRTASQEYNYHVYCDSPNPAGFAPGPIRLVAESSYRDGPSFEGSPADFDGAALERADDEDEVEEVDPDEHLRQAALARLTSEEKRVLGLSA
jgi:hypothetical protein